MSELQIVYEDVELAVGTLATKDCIVVNSKIDASRLNGFRIMKTEYWMDYEGKTDGEGPVMVGFACNHNAAEIEEAIESDPQDPTQNGNELAKRPVFPLEMIPETHGADAINFNTAKGSIKPKWSVPEGKGAA